MAYVSSFDSLVFDLWFAVASRGRLWYISGSNMGISALYSFTFYVFIAGDTV